MMSNTMTHDDHHHEHHESYPPQHHHHHSGDKRTGNFIGHFIPALFYWSGGFFMLLLMVKRTVAASNQRKKKRHTTTMSTSLTRYIPERNLRLLQTCGIYLCSTTWIGILLEGPILRHVWISEDSLTHQTGYVCYFLVGIISLLESQQRLPHDSIRMGLALSLFLQGMILNGHAHMKPNPVDEKCHVVYSYLSFVAGSTLVYSIHQRRNVMAYVLGYTFFIVLGNWSFTLGLYADRYIDISHHLIDVYVSIQLLAVLLVLVLVTSILYKRTANYKGVMTEDDGHDLESEQQPQHLPHQEDDDETTALTCYDPTECKVSTKVETSRGKE